MQAALRDASFYRTHKLTISSGQELSVKWHPFADGMSRCGRLVCEETAIEAEKVSPAGRCMRPGCRQAWERRETAREGR